MMVVGVLRLDLRLFDSQSLKQKRSQVARILNRLRSRYPISIAEVGCQDLLQRTVVGVSMAAGREVQINSVFLKVEEELYRSGLAELINAETEILHYGEELN